MINFDYENELFDRLKAISRSFYFSLRFLPPRSRRSVSLAYLLARLADSLADLTSEQKAADTIDNRQVVLNKFRDAISAERGLILEREERLLYPAEVQPFLNEAPLWLGRFLMLPESERRLIKKVLLTLISGMQMDFDCFPAGKLSFFPNRSSLEEYIYRIAGCVGEFWTQIHVCLYPERFERCSVSELVEMGICYGKGLQLINIIRDLGEDLERGRVYWPVESFGISEAEIRTILQEVRGDSTQTVKESWRHVSKARGELLEMSAAYLDQASGFCSGLPRLDFRLRFSSQVPLAIARKTWDLIHRVPVETMIRTPQRIRRSSLYFILARSLISLPF